MYAGVRGLWVLCKRSNIQKKLSTPTVTPMKQNYYINSDFPVILDCLPNGSRFRQHTKKILFHTIL